MNYRKLTPISRAGWSNLEWRHYDNDWNIEYLFDTTEFQVLLNGISNIQNKLPQLKKGNTILIDKNSEVPRPKLKEFIADNEYKKVTLMSKANIIAIRRESVKYIQSIEHKSIKILSDYDKNRIANPTDGLVMFQPNNEATMDQEYFDVKNNCSDIDGYIISGYRKSKELDTINFILDAVNSSAVLVYDDVLLNEINSNGLDLDEDIFDTIDGMLLSKDNDTFQLGIEMISNMNLENNLFKISILMNECYNKTSRLNSLSNIKNRNFKSLVAYLSANGIRWNQKWDSYGMSMLVKFSGTQWEPNIKEYMIKCLNHEFNKLNIKDQKEIVDIVFK